MIRVRKCQNPPKELEKAYNDPNVCRQLLLDQDDKCYICERELATDYQVDHFISQKEKPHYAKEWMNLFIACSYCNGKKSNKTNLLNPLTDNIEDIIHHGSDFYRKKVIFTPTNDSEQAAETVKLLSHIYNGKNNMRATREERFYDEYERKITIFLKVVNKYLANPNQEYKERIIELLDIKSELLGFKYAIINDNSKLKSEFAQWMKWNK